MNEFLNLLFDVWNAGLFGISLGPIISSIFTIIVALLLRGFVINIVIIRYIFNSINSINSILVIVIEEFCNSLIQ